MVLIGLAHWTLVEYLVHRAIFHVDGMSLLFLTYRVRR